MSHTRHDHPAVRLQRSVLAVPGSSPRMFDKAIASDADCVFLDLEDAVAPSSKAEARANVIKALNELDWRAAGKSVSVRVNGIDTPFFYRDLVDVLEQAGHRLDTVILPKAGVAADIYLVDALVTQISAAKDIPHYVGIEALIETALGLANVETIATASPRLEALHLGVADLAASLRARTVSIGGLNPDYPGDPWHAAQARVVTACRAFGLRAVDGPYGDFNDPQGFLDAARRTAALGFEGKWAIHPCQIAPANEVYSPTDDEVTQARRLLEALERAEAEGRGAAQLDGRMIDAASARQAANVMAIHERIRSR